MKNIKYDLLKKCLKYIILILFIIITILFIIITMKYFYLKHFIKSFKETFEQKEKECKGRSFCAYDLNKDKCECVSQKDDARLQFPNNPECCNIQCNTLPKEKCVKESTTVDGLNLKYYCNVAGKCKEYNATMKDSVIMANICGIDNITNQYIMPFSSKEECERLSDVCNKYNDKNLSAAEVEKGCLNDTNCGMCYNESGIGKCVAGSPTGPNDLDKYYFCKPSEQKSNGSNGGIYKYGKEF